MHNGRRIHELDLFRFLAALAVVLFHYTFRGFNLGERAPLEFQALGGVFKYGYLGVEFFFLISGFVILMSAMNSDAKSFSIARISRLLPSIVVCASVTAVVSVVFGPPEFAVTASQYVLNLVMLNELVDVPYVDGVYWTLFIELRFYALVTVAVAAKSLHRVETVLLGWLALSVLGHVGALPSSLEYALLTEWSAYFIAGALFYLVRSNGASIHNVGSLAVCCGLSIEQAVHMAKFRSLLYQSEHSGLVVGSIIVAFYAIFFLVALDRLTVLNRPEFGPLGAMTFSLYLIHQNIGFIIFNRLGAEVNRWVLLVGTGGLVMLASYLFANYAEHALGRRVKLYLRSVTSRDLAAEPQTAALEAG